MAELYDDLKRILDSDGPHAAIDELCAVLREQQDFTGLFYALLMKKRHALGVSTVPTGSSTTLPKEVHGEYEDAIRTAAKSVGTLCLEAGNIPAAWTYFRILGETEPVRQALENADTADGDDYQALVDIAYHQGVHPKKGFDLLLDYAGICSAITLIGGHEFTHGPDVREYCIKRLVRALHTELVERLGCDIERQQTFRPSSRNVSEILAGRDWLFADDGYHIDVSHLSAVVQMSINLPKCEELDLARELCVYGQNLSPQLQFSAEPPFEDQYRDYGVYLAILAGDNVEDGLARFRAKVESASLQEAGTFPAETLVNLLLKTCREKEAVDIARRYLANAETRHLSCPGIVELCEQTGDFQTLAEVAREQNNAVHFLAGLLGVSRS